MNEDDLTSSLCALTIVDNTVDSVHLTVDTGLLSQEVVCDAGIARRRKLNAFLEECNVMPLNQKRMLPWEEASERTRERCVARTSEIITAVLNTVSVDCSTKSVFDICCVRNRHNNTSFRKCLPRGFGGSL